MIAARLARRRFGLAPTRLSIAMLALALCGLTVGASAQESHRLRVQIMWYHQAQFAGFYVAEALGLYDAKGIEVDLIEGGTGKDPLEALATGDADVAMSWVPGAIAARRRGLDVVNIAQVFDKPGIMILCRHDFGVRVADDIRGKTIGVWNVGEQLDLRYWLAEHGIAPSEVSLVVQRPNGADLIEGKVACAMAMSYNEYWHVLRGGLTPAELFIVRLSDQNASFLEDGLYVLESSLDDPARAQQLADFVDATIEGWRYARDNPSEALTFTLLRAPNLDPTHQRSMLEAVLRLLGPGNELGLLNLTAYDRSVAVIAADSADADAVRSAAREAWTHRLWYASGLGQSGFLKPTLATRHYLYLAVSSTWFYALSLLGTAAFALSGFMRAQQQNYNLWGAFMLAMMPALGGGTLRDLLIGGERHPPFIFQDGAYISVVLSMVAIGALFARFSPSHSIETPQFLRAKTLFDMIGMATYAAIGAEVAILAGLAWIWAPFCAALTCAGGGMLMDVITGREPRTFKGVPYEEIAVGGGFVLLAGLALADRHEHASWLVGASLISAMVFVFCVRRVLRAEGHHVVAAGDGEQRTQLTPLPALPRCAGEGTVGRRCANSPLSRAAGESAERGVRSVKSAACPRRRPASTRARARSCAGRSARRDRPAPARRPPRRSPPRPARGRRRPARPRRSAGRRRGSACRSPPGTPGAPACAAAASRPWTHRLRRGRRRAWGTSWSGAGRKSMECYRAPAPIASHSEPPRAHPIHE